MRHFEFRNRKRWRFISDRDVRQNDSRSPRWLLTVFVLQNFDMMLGFQSRDKWSLTNYDAIEIKNKGFYASSVTIPYDQNLTSTLKLRSALFSWLVVFLTIRKVTALSGGFPLQSYIMAMQNPEKSCHLYVNSLPRHPSLIIGSSCEQLFHLLSVQMMTSARPTFS